MRSKPLNVGFYIEEMNLTHEGDRTFQLKSGDKITGKIVDETDSIYKIQTSFGILEIDKNDIKPDEVSITLKSGDKITGTLIDESKSDYKVKTNFGELIIAKDSVEYINFLNQVKF